MKHGRLSESLLSWGAGGGLMLACTWFYSDSVERGAGLSPDALHYVSMVNGTGAPDPFRFRVLVPFLASLLPVSSEQGLKILTCLGLAGCYIALLRLARHVGVRPAYACGGLVAATMAAGHVYNYGNPFLTDGVGLALSTVAISAVVSGSLLLFTLSIVVASTCREATILVAVAWCHRGWRIALAVGGAGAVAYLIVRVSVGSTGFKNEFVAPRFMNGLTAWGSLWAAGPVGLLLVSEVRARRHLLLATAVLATIATALAFVASDTVRMVGVLFPMIALGTAVFIQRTADLSPSLAWSIVVITSAKGPITVTNRLIGAGSTAYTSSGVDAAVLAASTATVVAATLMLWRAHKRPITLPESRN